MFKLARYDKKQMFNFELIAAAERLIGETQRIGAGFCSKTNFH
jgi:hypothetical protein